MAFDRATGTNDQLLTIGYEKLNIDEFVAGLKEAGVEVLLDIRDLPLSRKKGFSKNGLKATLEAAGIEYLHFKALGDPKPGREAARAGKHDLFVEIFNKHISNDTADEAFEKIAEIIETKRACLLCFERCHETCHRAIVAEEISARTGAKVRHLKV
ncbi:MULTISPECIES: DUF488 family protein [unclassified Mameliella]|uniref:DUF488 domain-containing protein n=1 Tax=unclassified Mameliella TaxID=2630630 RepID=UPI00273ED9EF|nr:MULTISPECIES: DUF488 domain-containing protein [unclassified Mameliella]